MFVLDWLHTCECVRGVNGKHLTRLREMIGVKVFVGRHLRSCVAAKAGFDTLFS